MAKGGCLVGNYLDILYEEKYITIMVAYYIELDFFVILAV